jgi:hypothetical protein
MVISLRYFVINIWYDGSSHTSPTLLDRTGEDLRGFFTAEDIGLNWISRREEGRKCPWTLGIGNDEVMRRLHNAPGLEGKKHKGQRVTYGA